MWAEAAVGMLQGLGWPRAALLMPRKVLACWSKVPSSQRCARGTRDGSQALATPYLHLLCAPGAAHCQADWNCDDGDKQPGREQGQERNGPPSSLYLRAQHRWTAALAASLMQL